MSSAKSPTSDETDVIIVGAGIAGTSLAYLLSRSGIKTTLIERHTDLDREFRGFGFQPLTLRLFDEMNVLEDVYALDPVRVDDIQLNTFGTDHTVFDPSSLSGPYDHQLLMEQPPLLRMFIEKAGAYETFEYRDGTPATGLLKENGRISGVRAKDRESGDETTICSQVVVASDGRYSTIRNQLDINPNRFDSEIELIWIKLPNTTSEKSASVYLNEYGALSDFGLPGSEIQVGLIIDAGTYPEIRDRGIQAFKDRLAANRPKYAAAINESLTGFEQCSLLRIAPGVTEEWIRDGLVLVGDAAHVASPFGGQGNLMALEDAVSLHPILVDAIQNNDETRSLSAATLSAFEDQRRPTVEATINLQWQMEQVINWQNTNRELIPPDSFDKLFSALFSAAGPNIRSRTEKMMVGIDPTTVSTSYFISNSDGDSPNTSTEDNK